MSKIHILPCGSTIVDEALPFSNKSKKPLAFTGILRGKKHKISVPVTAYLIEHPKGLILVDTGWDTAVRTNARKYEGFFNYFASPGFLPEGEGIVDQLSLFGYRTSDLDYCILTHMDIDHAGGTAILQMQNTFFAAQRSGQPQAKTTRAISNGFGRICESRPFPIRNMICSAMAR